MAGKLPFSGIILSVQPRIKLLRSFDEVSHQYSGYTLRLNGLLGPDRRIFKVGIGKAAHAKFQFGFCDKISGEGEWVIGEATNADIYKTSKLRVLERGQDNQSPPPWHILAPALEVYRERGHRRLDLTTYEERCSTCVWGCLMPVEIIVDHWKPDVKKYRQERFCYGPVSCGFYKAGPGRRVPGRKGMVHVEENWIDEQNVAHRKDE